MELNILGYKYTLDTSKTIEELEGCAGLTNFTLKSLAVANDLGEDMFNSTFIHEIIEAVNYHLELNLEHPQIMALEVSLHQIFNDNGVDLRPITGYREELEDGRSDRKLSGDVLLEAKSST